MESVWSWLGDTARSIGGVISHVVEVVARVCWDGLKSVGSFIEQIDYGTMPDWFAAVGTVAALFWAVYVYAENVDQVRRHQARLVVPSDVTRTPYKKGQSIDNPPASLDDFVDVNLIQTVTSGVKYKVLKDLWLATFEIQNENDTAIVSVFPCLVVAGATVDGSVGKMIPTIEGKKTKTVALVIPRRNRVLVKWNAYIEFRDSTGTLWERTGTYPPNPVSNSDGASRPWFRRTRPVWATAKGALRKVAASRPGRSRR